jgi:transposase
MGEIARGADGRRLFTAEFKKEQIGRVLSGEITQSQLCRELDVEVSVVRKWRRLVEQGSQTAVAANEEVVPASALRQAQQRIRELERALGRKTMEVEILQMAQEEVKKRPSFYGVSGKKASSGASGTR